jgi:hypothetical protein
MSWSIPNKASAPVSTEQAKLWSSALGDLVAGANSYGVIYGGEVTFDTGRTFDVSAGQVMFGSDTAAATMVDVAADSVTLDASPTPRVDVIQVEDDGTVSVVKGGASGAEPEPTTNSYRSIKLAAVLVDGATLSADHISDRRVMVAPRYPGVRPTLTRRTHCEWATTTPTTSTEYTIFDSYDTNYGGDGTTGAGWVSKLAFMMGTNNANWQCERLKIYYDGEASATVNIPLAAWFSAWHMTPGSGWSSNRIREFATYVDRNVGGAGTSVYYHRADLTSYIAIPFIDRVKITVTTPASFGTYGAGAHFSIVDWHRGYDPRFGVGTGHRKLRVHWHTGASELDDGTDTTGYATEAVKSGTVQGEFLDLGPATQLTASCTDVATTLTVKDSSNLTQHGAVPFDCWLENEKVTVTATTSTTLTVTRGVGGTTAVAHSADAGDDDPPVLVDVVRDFGPGRVRFVSMSGGATSAIWMEGRHGIAVDSDPSFAVLGMGTEDFYSAGWYNANIHAGGEAASASMGSTLCGSWWARQPGSWAAASSKMPFWRSFPVEGDPADPLLFSRGFTWKTQVSEVGQGSWSGDTMWAHSTCFFYTED